MKWKRKLAKMETQPLMGFSAGKITLETEFSTVSECWGLLDKCEEATWIFSKTLVLWFALRRRKWHFWTILDCSVYESFRTGKKKNPAVCAIIVLSNLCFSGWQKCFESKEWVGDSQQMMTGALCPHEAAESQEWAEQSSYPRCCSRSDVLHMSASFQTEASPHLHGSRLWHRQYY